MGKAGEPEGALIGREHDLAEIERRFAAGARLVTLLGPGGIGKTTLAAAYLSRHRTAYAGPGAGSARWCDLTAASTLSAVTYAVAGALGLRLVEARDDAAAIELVGRALARRRHVLLVLDNCEQVATCLALCLRAWLTAAPRARFLVTSRITLAIAEELTWPVHGLPHEGGEPDAPHAAGNEALRLFLRCAAKVRPTRELVGDELAVAAEIVARLQGWPLAIELAAARTRTLALPELLARLARPLEVLARSRDPGRHRSIREIVLATVRLLDEDAARGFAGTSVFRGGFTRAAAAAVLPNPRGVDAALDQLCEASLLRRLDVDGEVARYDLFEPIREVARELAGDSLGAFTDAHARYYAALGVGLDAEVDNALAAYEHLLATDPRAALDIACALDASLARRGSLRLRARLLEDAIVGAPDIATVQLALGRARYELGDHARAREALETAARLARESDEAIVEARAIAHLGELIEVGGQTDVACREYARALARLDAAMPSSERLAAAAAIHAQLGHALRREGSLDDAEAHFAIALDAFRERDATEGVASVCYELGVVAMFRGRHEVARRYFDEGLALARASGGRQLEAALRSGRGVLVQERGDLDGAIGDHAAAVEAFRDLGNRHREASAMYYLASAYVERGDYLSSDSIIARAITLAAEVGAKRYVALLNGLAAAAAAVRGRFAVAERHLAEAATAARACERERALTATLALHRLHVDRSSGAAARAFALADATENDDTRLARRLHEGRARSTGARVEIAADGSRIRIGDAPPIDLGRRAPLRRIVRSLALRRRDSPGEPLDLDELAEAGWPGEKMHREAAINRVHVALSALRQLGLRELLLTEDQGYLFDPKVSLTV